MVFESFFKHMWEKNNIQEITGNVNLESTSYLIASNYYTFYVYYLHCDYMRKEFLSLRVANRSNYGWNGYNLGLASK